MKVLLQCKQIVGDDNITSEATYILTEHIRSDCPQGRAYGFIIEENVLEGDVKEKKLAEQVKAVFEDYETAEYFYGILVREKALPTTLIYHIDDWNSAFSTTPFP